MSVLPEGEERTIRLRCIEAAARNPAPHADGYTAGILQSAQKFAAWVMAGDKSAEGVNSLL